VWHDLHRGDQYIHLKVRIPKKVTERQKELLKEFEGEGGGEAASGGTDKDGFTLDSAWKRLKEFLGTDKDDASDKDKKKKNTEDGDKKSDSR
jgi:DnaJ-class molecular chaperone